MPLQVIFMGGSFEYSKVIGWWIWGGEGLNFGRAPIQWGEIIHKFVHRATAARKTKP